MVHFMFPFAFSIRGTSERIDALELKPHVSVCLRNSRTAEYIPWLLNTEPIKPIKPIGEQCSDFPIGDRFSALIVFSVNRLRHGLFSACSARRAAIRRLLARPISKQTNRSYICTQYTLWFDVLARFNLRQITRRRPRRIPDEYAMSI